jgi:RsiW-degrading membrane proteinase PrsW (M82 family)
MSPFLLLLALLPAAILLIRVYRLDTIEKEPSGLLWKLVIFGALSGVVAAVAEWALGWALGRLFVKTTVLYLVLENFVVVGLTEELCKRWPVKRFAWSSRAFNYRFDAVVYCVFSALGFAALENVLYVAQFGFGTAVTRALLSVPGHFFFAVYMGMYLGEAKLAEHLGQYARRAHFLRCSVLVPTLLHGFWDFSLSFRSWKMTVVFYAFVLFFFLFANRRLTIASRNDVPV